MVKTAALFMAAGIGSRYGAGIKQLAKAGPGGEILLDYSVFDSLRAGFDTLIFVIRHDIEAEFREVIGKKVEAVAHVEYAFQDLKDLPGGFVCPPGRTKPWGTGQAVLAARDLLDCPYIVLNADDFYGASAFKGMHESLLSGANVKDGVYSICMPGFVIENTLSENGTVTRGVCRTDAAGFVTAVRETYGICRRDGKIIAAGEDGKEICLAEGSTVSMNMWGLPAEFTGRLESGFEEFLRKDGCSLKGEFLLPGIIDRMIRDGEARVRQIPTADRWFGVTYSDDLPAVKENIRALVGAGAYPADLYAALAGRE